MGNNNVRRQKRSLSKNSVFCVCCYCHHWFLVDDLTIEHIVPKMFGGSNKLSNLSLACEACNLHRGREQWVEFRNLHRLNIKRQQLLTILKTKAVN